MALVVLYFFTECRSCCLCVFVVCTPVVVRNSLLPFDCSTRDGLSTMDAEPSIVCDTDNPVFYRMCNVAATCLLLYGMGVPAFFAGFVFKYVDMLGASFLPPMHNTDMFAQCWFGRCGFAFQAVAFPCVGMTGIIPSLSGVCACGQVSR